MKKPTLSIVTVSYNAAREIGKTMESVLAQTWTDFEYLFIDGASVDDTVARISAMQSQFEDRGISCRVVSEPDEGIYDAMNKAIAMAEGEWILMLNAGDILTGAHVLERIFRDRQYTADVLYGHTVVAEVCRGRTFFRKVPAKPLTHFGLGMPFCHQSVFARGRVLREYRFNTDFQVVADYDQFLRLWRSGKEFQQLDIFVSVFDNAGTSMRHPLKTIREYGRVRKKAGFRQSSGWLRNILPQVKAALRNTARKLLPGMFYSSFRGWQREFPRDI